MPPLKTQTVLFLIICLLLYGVEVDKALNNWTESLHTMNKLELELLCVGAVFLALVGLLVLDVIRTRRMASSVLLLIAISFMFSCLWNWRSMIKEVETRRAADWERRGAGSRNGPEGPPSECREQGFWAWVVGADAACQKYYSEVFLSPAEEVSIEEVVSRTVATFFMTPLRIIGRQGGHFFKEFYGAVPLVYQTPASVILVVLLVLIFGMVLLIRPGRPGNPPAPAIDMENQLIWKTITNQD